MFTKYMFLNISQNLPNLSDFIKLSILQCMREVLKLIPSTEITI